MGYYADGDGYITFKEVLSDENYESLYKILSWAFEDVDGYPKQVGSDGKVRTSINFWTSDKYYEDEVMDVLNAALRFGEVYDGELRYFGEDKTYWRFVYDGKRWQEECGEVVYGNDRNRIQVDLANGNKLVAECGYDPNYPREIFIGIESEGGVWVQDLAYVSQKYSYVTDEIVYDDNNMSVKVYADQYTEDYTHDFTIGIYAGEV